MQTPYISLLLLLLVLILLCVSCQAVEDIFTRVGLGSSGGGGDLLRGVQVPHFALVGGQVTLGCSFHLDGTPLYSLKWYHNGTEFYRYVPTERDRSINTQPLHKFSVTEVFRSPQRVTLSLTRLTQAASGQYRCEVIAEHPSFRTETAAALLTVLSEPLSPPIVEGGREMYEVEEVVKVGCRPPHYTPPRHTPTLTWLIHGQQVKEEWVSHQESGGLSLQLPGNQVAAAGGTVQAECRMRLGQHSLSAHKTLRVRVRKVSYVGPFQSSGGVGRQVWGDRCGGGGGGGGGRGGLVVMVCAVLVAMVLNPN